MHSKRRKKQKKTHHMSRRYKYPAWKTWKDLKAKGLLQRTNTFSYEARPTNQIIQVNPLFLLLLYDPTPAYIVPSPNQWIESKQTNQPSRHRHRHRVHGLVNKQTKVIKSPSRILSWLVTRQEWSRKVVTNQPNPQNWSTGLDRRRCTIQQPCEELDFTSVWTNAASSVRDSSVIVAGIESWKEKISHHVRDGLLIYLPYLWSFSYLRLVSIPRRPRDWRDWFCRMDEVHMLDALKSVIIASPELLYIRPRYHWDGRTLIVGNTLRHT